MTVPHLPTPDQPALAHSARVVAAVRAAIVDAGGWISLADYLQWVLYAPGLGYYVAGARKFGAAGDFVTAPEMTPLFARALATQVAPILAATATREVIEYGAGSGALAADLLTALAARDALPSRYRIVEISPELRERQQALLAKQTPALASLVEWLEAPPESIDGAVIMNEVLDAVAAHVVVRRGGEWFERGVELHEGATGSAAVAPTATGLRLADRPLRHLALRDLAQQRFPAEVDYVSEISPAAEALVADVAARMSGGALLLIDYGFPQREYYHLQRSQGTLMGHYRHFAHADPLLWPGLSDLTVHVDFTAMAQAGVGAGLNVAGYASQAALLVGCGILDQLLAVGAPTSLAYVREAAAVQRLLSPAEMGELFKILALEKSPGIAWPAFAAGDRSHRL